MANTTYVKAREKILSASINLPADTIKVALVSTGYAPSIAGDEFYSDIAAFVVDAPETLTGKTVTGGVFDAADVTFAAVAAGPTVKGVAIYKDTGVAGTSPLIAFYDVLTGFPFVASGVDMTVRWSSGAYKIFAI